MLIRTHLVTVFFVSLLLIDRVSNPYVFVVVALFSTFLPDLDSSNSKLGKKFFSRVLTAFTKHRGIMHSLIFLFGVYFLLDFYFPFVSFGFLIGYGTHLVGDSFTKRGLKLFYPFKFKIKGFLKTGGRMESFLFLIFVILSLITLLLKAYSKLL